MSGRTRHHGGRGSRGLLGVAVAGLLALAAAGCSAYVGRAQRDYSQGRFLEVAERLAEHEEDVEYLSARAKVEYGTYRGAALLVLGDATGAARWIAYARSVEQASPGALRPEPREVLYQAGWQLDQLRARSAAKAKAAPDPRTRGVAR